MLNEEHAVWWVNVIQLKTIQTHLSRSSIVSNHLPRSGIVTNHLSKSGTCVLLSIIYLGPVLLSIIYLGPVLLSIIYLGPVLLCRKLLIFLDYISINISIVQIRLISDQSHKFYKEYKTESSVITNDWIYQR